jgi:hypothetical protein
MWWLKFLGGIAVVLFFCMSFTVTFYRCHAKWDAGQVPTADEQIAMIVNGVALGVCIYGVAVFLGAHQ